MTGWGALALAVLFVQLMLGAWVAGFRAGYVSNSWPRWTVISCPPGSTGRAALCFALTHDLYLLHFIHRWWAWVVVAVLVLFARRVRKRRGARPASIAIHTAFGTQIILGILTVLSGIALWLAVLHQATGALLVAATVWGAHELGSAAMSVVSVYAVFADAEEAERIGRTVIEERLAACINILARPLDLSLERQDRGCRRGRGHLQDAPMAQRCADRTDRRPAQLRHALYCQLADRQDPRRLCRLGRGYGRARPLKVAGQRGS